MSELLPLTAVVAIAKPNRAIGLRGQLPWGRIPEDLRHFKRVTLGHAIIMGRKTFESVGRPLPERTNIVVTRGGDRIEGCLVARSIERAIELARVHDKSPMVIGGAQIYEAAMPMLTRVELTELDRKVEGDAFFPALDASEWRELSRTPGETEGVTFVTLERA